jgi:uncharacterized protein (TIGR01319 family)
MPTDDQTLFKGLPEPYSKRTVEGDVGMRYSANSTVEAVGIKRAAELAELPPERVQEWLAEIDVHKDILPRNTDEQSLDDAIAASAVETAVTRHAGTKELVYTPAGPVYSQTGKDLTGIRTLVLTGGAIIKNPKAAQIGAHALFNAKTPNILKPTAAKPYVDRRYILAAMGLLAGEYPETALAVMKKELI